MKILPIVFPVLALIATTFEVTAQNQGVYEPPPGDDSLCGNRSAFSAVGRLPAVRVVVFDPVSNSFGFVAPCAPGDEKTQRNQDYLDRRRLALTTQKIRLLIMPYNASHDGGDLVLNVSYGEGIEFQPLYIAADTKTPAAAPASGDSDQDQGKEAKESPKPPDVTPTPATASVVGKSPEAKAGAAAAEDATSKATTGGGIETQDAASLQAFSRDPAAYLLGVITELKLLYRNGMLQPQARLRSVRTAIQCVEDTLDSMAQSINHQLVGRSGHFTLAHDVTWQQLLQEEEARGKIITSAQSKSFDCALLDDDGPVKDTDFARNVRNIETVLNETDDRIGDYQLVLDRIADAIGELATRGAPSTRINGGPAYTASEWRSELTTLREDHRRLTEFHSKVITSVEAARRLTRNVVSRHAKLVQMLNGPPAKIQRFNFPPLRENQSINFWIGRGKPGQALPSTANAIELKSAPVDYLRFGLGLVSSYVKDPTFKVGPETTVVDEDDNEVKVKTLFHEDENDGRVVPGAFIHNYWGPRSPLLQPTRWEKFVPTIIMGIPLAKTDAFDQLMLGLDWELVPGVEFATGVHFAKVTRLAEGYEVGDEIPATLDTTTITFKQYRPALFFGVVLNSDAFTKLVANRDR